MQKINDEPTKDDEWIIDSLEIDNIIVDPQAKNNVFDKVSLIFSLNNDWWFNWIWIAEPQSINRYDLNKAWIIIW